MRHILLSLIVLSALLYSCENMYKAQEKYEGEIVYPARFDTIVGHIGYERVELDLMKAGRIRSSQINMGKAKKTVIEYDGQVKTIDSLVSYVNITGLSAAKLYRFKVYSIDEFGNKSVPQGIALIPYTASDFKTLQVASPRLMLSPSSAVVDWPSGISSVLINYYSLTFEYTDKDGIVKSGSRGADSRFFIGNNASGKAVTVKMSYKIIPKVGSEPILDTLIVKDNLVLNMPIGSTEFSVSERDILTANGVTVSTADGVSAITKLVYPVHANSLQDIFYFPNLKTLDLTGGTLFPVPKTVYDRNVARNTVGGGAFESFMRKAGDISSGNMQALKDLLESGMLTKVYYRPNTMGLDDLLAPFVASGIVELIQNPSSVLVGNQFNLDGNVQDGNWNVDVVYPATDAPAGVGLENVYKVTCRATSSSFVFAFPKGYQLNAKEYKYLKMKVYAPSKSILSGTYSPFQRIWPRIMNNLWSFGGNSNFGQEYWEKPPFTIADADLQKWTEISIDMSEALGKHSRVFVINIGGEPWVDFNPPAAIVYYFANIRFTKN